MFHVFLLEPYQQRPGEQPAPPRPDIINGKEEWEIEAILDTRMYRRCQQYLIKWEGFPTYENSWAYEKDMPNTQTILCKFKNCQVAGTKKAKQCQATQIT